jgi:hypothetical protein
MKKSYNSCCTNVEYKSHSYYKNTIKHAKILCKSGLKQLFIKNIFEQVLWRLCNKNDISIPRQYIYIVCVCVCIYIYI